LEFEGPPRVARLCTHEPLMPFVSRVSVRLLPPQPVVASDSASRLDIEDAGVLVPLVRSPIPFGPPVTSEHIPAESGEDNNSTGFELRGRNHRRAARLQNLGHQIVSQSLSTHIARGGMGELFSSGREGLHGRRGSRTAHQPLGRGPVVADMLQPLPSEPAHRIKLPQTGELAYIARPSPPVLQATEQHVI